MNPAAGPARPRVDPNIVALLSLKLLLLGFFILLNALSSYEEDRARRVLESVNEAFDGRVEARESHAPFQAALGSLEETAAMIGAIGRLFKSRIPAVRSEASFDGTRLRLELAAGSLFKPGTTQLQPGRGLLLNRFAKALLRGGRTGLDYEMEILHGVPAGAVRRLAAAGADALEVQRTSQLVRDLIGRGVPPDRLSVGLIPGRAGRLQLVVQTFEGPPRRLDYGELAE